MRRGRPWAALAFLAAIFLAPAAWAAGLWVEPLPLAQGQPALVRAEAPAGAGQVWAELLGRRVALDRGADGMWYGLAAPDLDDPPGETVLRLMIDGKQAAAAAVRLAARDYGTRRITVASKFMKLTPEQLARYHREVEAIRKAVATYTPRRQWRGGFEPPVPGKLVGTFGRKSVINGEPKSSHGGVDLRGAEGAPVAAAAAGRVVLVMDTYFGGNTVILDHGQGVISRYLHLSAVEVAEGQDVALGQEIGKVGATGRVTGPHLHWDLRLCGARVDPMAWLAASRNLSDRLEVVR